MTAQFPPKILIARSALDDIRNWGQASLDGSETGGILLGTTEHCVVVRHAGGPGPGAIRRPDRFLRDLRHAQALADRAFTHDQSVWIGEWHTHISAPPVPSNTDIATYRRLLADTELAFDYFVAIILADSTNTWHVPRATGWIAGARRLCRVPIEWKI